MLSGSIPPHRQSFLTSFVVKDMSAPRSVNSTRFPLRLKQARQRNGLTMEAAAEAAGLESKQAWQAYEVGRITPKIDLCGPCTFISAAAE